MGNGARRRKFWGWGFEDQQPPHEEVERAAAAAREHLGFDPAVVERPAQLERLDLPRPRLEPPPALAELCAADPYERAAHAHDIAVGAAVRVGGGVEPTVGDVYTGVVTLDLRRLGRVLEID